MSAPTPGWYPDPARPDLVRWFDGTGWTEHVTPVAPGAAQPTPGPTRARWSGAKIAAVVSLGVVGLLIVLGVLAAIAVPVVLEQQKKDAFAQSAAAATCVQVGEEAVTLSRQDTPEGYLALESVASITSTEDVRATATRPPTGGVTYVMTCQGVATWEDGSTSTIRLSLSIDSEGTHVIENVTDPA